jgi:hypothetical protein
MVRRTCGRKLISSWKWINNNNTERHFIIKVVNERKRSLKILRSDVCISKSWT